MFPTKVKKLQNRPVLSAEEMFIKAAGLGVQVRAECIGRAVVLPADSNFQNAQIHTRQCHRGRSRGRGAGG